VAAMTLSISRGKMFSPPRMIISLRRPSIRKLPWASIEPRSPVCSQPSASIAAAVASGSSK
jgi:hypothetical protein